MMLRIGQSDNGWKLGFGAALYNVAKALEKLSSGNRINHASDDSAGLVISEQLRSNISSLQQEIENYQMTLGKYRTASSAVSEMRSQLHDLRSLAIGASNEAGNDQSVQDAFANSAAQIVRNFNDSIKRATYNGSQLFGDSDSAVGKIDELTGIDLSTPESAQASLALIDEAGQKLDALQVDLGSKEKYEFESNIRSLDIAKENLTAAESMIRDTDYAETISFYLANLIRAKASTAMMSFIRTDASMVSELLRLGGNRNR